LKSKLNSGEQLWNETWGGSKNDIGRAITFDSSENIFISGYKYTERYYYEMFLIKYDNSAPEILKPIEKRFRKRDKIINTIVDRILEEKAIAHLGR